MRRIGTDWMEQAECAKEEHQKWDLDDFIFSMSMARQQRFADKVCANCPVREDCAEYALVNKYDHGVFGGITSEQRHRMRGLQRRRSA